VPLLDNRPELTLDASHFLAIFQELNSCRHRDGATPISVQDVYYYCELNDITGAIERSEIFSMIKYADSLFLSFNEKASKNATRNKI